MPDTITPRDERERFTPLTQTQLHVGDGHALYVESIGTIGSMPAVYLHGGPGSGCQPDHRKLFDPEKFHAVLFDQRGCGRSTPKGSRESNTTHHLIDDMEKIRAHFGFEQWLLVGGSWGATLAIAYAEQHPDRVSGIVLRAAFLATRAELEWAFMGGLEKFNPGLFDDFNSLLTPGERAAPLDAYWRRILDPDSAIHGPAARFWYATERVLSEIKPSVTRLDLAALSQSNRMLPSSPFMEAHYFSSDTLLHRETFLANAGKLAGIPGIIVQGRYDMLCPPQTAQALAAAWPGSELRIVENAGHSLGDPGVADAVRQAILQFI